MYDFANLLFSGPCNAHCPYCIGRQVDSHLSQNNLDRYPPLNLEAFIAAVKRHNIRQVIFSGTNTDPQLYHHEARLLTALRQDLPPGTQFSLHTNGRLALPKMNVLNLYDRVSISFPSFNPRTYYLMMGVSGMPHLQEIVRRATAPIKISCVISDQNAPEIPGYLEQCHALGIQRIALRKLFGETRNWEELLPWDDLPLKPAGNYKDNPVYEIFGIQITLWDFARSNTRSINLFSNGLISTSYLVTEAHQASSG